MRWALSRVGVPYRLVSAIFRLYASAFVHSIWGGGVSSHSLPVIRGIRQGCPASGTLWALLYDPVVRRVWRAIPRGDGLLAVFADDIAVVLKTVFRDWRRVRDAFAEFRRLMA